MNSVKTVKSWLYPPQEEKGRWAAVLFSDWLPGLSRYYTTTGAECFCDGTWPRSGTRQRRKAASVRVKTLVFCHTSALTELMFMAKRQAEETLLNDSPSKRCCRSLYGVDMQRVSMAATGGVSPPSLLALLGSRSRKRPLYFEDPEKLQREEEDASLYRKTTHCGTRKLAVKVSAEQTAGNFQDSRSPSSALISSKKRPREDCAASETIITKENDKVNYG